MARSILTILCIASLLACGDGKEPEDGGSDAPADPTGEDAAADTAAETDGPCTGLTGGDCNVVEQCGCGGEDACQVLIDTDTCEAIERCLPLTDSLDIGDECERSDECQAGSSCLSFAGAARRCYEWCRTTADCTGTGAECFLSVNWTSPPTSPTCPGETITPPYLVCTLP